jgi:CubicO group peptidase (beta-lactamase class C family)
MILLGKVLENIHKNSYSNLINKYFNLALNMNNTETVYFDSDTNNYTKGYDKKGRIMPHITFQIAGAAGGLKSSTYEMIKYIKANLSKDDAAIKLSHTSTFRNNEKEVGLGWQIRYDILNEKLLWHDGGEPGFSSFIAIMPGRNTGIICLANQRGRQNQLEKLTKSILENIYSFKKIKLPD